MIDFERTYRHRRAIYLALQQSQKSESLAAQQSAKIAVNCKRELLIYLSAWLLELSSVNALTAAERTEIQSLTQMPLEKWVPLQLEAIQFEKDLKGAVGREKEAISLLDKAAPYRAATKMFAGAESKSQIKSLQNDVAAAQKRRENHSKAVDANVKKRQEFGEAFFRDCLRQWDKLASTQALGKEAGAILNRMTQGTNAIWAGHLKQQAECNDLIGKVFQNLDESYKQTPTTLLPQYVAPAPQEQSDADIPQGNLYDLKEK